MSPEERLHLRRQYKAFSKWDEPTSDRDQDFAVVREEGDNSLEKCATD